jgi:uncharacterized protein (DUF736 family)
MATIGSFKQDGNDFTGSVQTLAFKAKLTIKAVDKASDTAPDYRVLAGAVEVGAAWSKVSKGRRALRLAQARRSELRGPDLRDPVRQGRGRSRPIWSRRSPDGAALGCSCWLSSNSHSEFLRINAA